MLGQLQDAGNTTTLAHYLELLGGAGLLCGLEKYALRGVRSRGSSPKLLTLDNALISATSGISFDDARTQRDHWGRLVESAVGAYLVNSLRGDYAGVNYWRERDQEVDYILANGTHIIALEVKSGARKEQLSGIESFTKLFKPTRMLLIGGDGIPLEEFLSSPIERWCEE